MENVIARGFQRTRDSLELSPTARIARWSAQHRWWVLLASVMVISLATVVSSTVETKIRGEDRGVGDAGTGFELIDQRFDVVKAPTEQLVFRHASFVAEDPEYKSTVQGLVDKLRALPDVVTAASYYDIGHPGMVSTDRHVVLAQVEINTGGRDYDRIAAIKEAIDAAAPEDGGF